MSPVLSPILIHVPHSSLLIPPEQLPLFIPPDLRPELLRMTDRYCDELFACNRPMLSAKVSRLVCDMERFPKDCDEPMAEKGMGFAYTRCSDGSVLRVLDSRQKRCIYREYYAPHHRAFTRMAETALYSTGKCLIIDGHSFSPVPLPHEDDRNNDRPDFCIGTDGFHTPDHTRDFIAQYLCDAGFSVKINSPFSGAIVPMKYYRKDARVSSVMIEINRKLYMDSDGEKNSGFESVGVLMRSLLYELEILNER